MTIMEKKLLKLQVFLARKKKRKEIIIYLKSKQKVVIKDEMYDTNRGHKTALGHPSI